MELLALLAPKDRLESTDLMDFLGHKDNPELMDLMGRRGLVD